MLQELFPGFFRPTEDDFRQMWEEGVIALDANILLHAYRYSPQLRDTLFLLIEKIGDRLFIPHRVAYEFSKNRLTVISSQEKAYDEMISAMGKAGAAIASGLPPRHSVVDIDDIKNSFSELINNKQNLLRQLKTKHPSIPDGDPTLARLSELVKGRIGPPLSPDSEQKVIEEGEKRFKAKIPPGFRDAGKDDEPLHKFGDLILWRQILDRVREVSAKFLIFATDDSSDDWWGRHDGKTFGPHPTLVQEAKDVAKCRAYLYRGDQFIQFGSRHFEMNTAQNLIDEAATVWNVIPPDLDVVNPMHPFRTSVKGILPIEELRQKELKTFIRKHALRNPTFFWKFHVDGTFELSFEETYAYSIGLTEMIDHYGAKMLKLSREMLNLSPAESRESQPE